MLTTLLESKSHRVRDNRGTAASVTLHALIIFAAVFATAAGAPPHNDRVPRLHFIRIPRPLEIPRAPAPSKICFCLLPQRVAPVSVNIPTSIPSIDVPLGPATSELSHDVSSSASASAPASDTGNTGRRAYDASEVETGVSAVGNTIPEYPSALRSSGIEGRVVAEFVVTENGRVDVTSLRILSSTNELFAESIRRALSRMKFRPATIGGHSVPQLVQQQFVFKLD